MLRKITTALIALLLVFGLFMPVWADTEGTEGEMEEEVSNFCKMGTVHPNVMKLTQIYGIENGDVNVVMGWVCDGLSIDDLKAGFRQAAEEGEDGVTIEELTAIFFPEAEEGEDQEGEEEGEEEEIEDPEGMEESEDGEDTGKMDSFYCRDGVEKQHPTLTRYDEMYDTVDYEDLQEWFCEGFGIGQIKHALATAEGDKEGAKSFLENRADGMGWGAIWKEVGKPVKEHPVFGADWKQDKSQGPKTSAAPKGKPAKPEK